VRLPDRDHSAALLIAGTGADVDRLQELRAALTDPAYGGFAPDRCRVLNLRDTIGDVPATDTLVVYFAGQTLSEFTVAMELAKYPAENKLLIADCTSTSVTDGKAIDIRLVKDTEWTEALVSVSPNARSTFGDVALRGLRDGMRDGPELISLNLLADLCRRQTTEPVFEKRGDGELALVRNRAHEVDSRLVELLDFRNRADNATKCLLARASLLEPGDLFVFTHLLPEFPPAEAQAAATALLGGSFMAPGRTGQFASPELRSAAGSFLGLEPVEIIADIQFALRQQRMVRDGIAPRPHLTRGARATRRSPARRTWRSRGAGRRRSRPTSTIWRRSPRRWWPWPAASPRTWSRRAGRPPASP